MIKFYPFYDYYIQPKDGLSFDSAVYYTTVSTDSGYINQSQDNTEDLAHYFLVDFQRQQQYLINIQKRTYDFPRQLKFSIYKQNNYVNQIAFYEQVGYDYGDGWFYYEQQLQFYLKIYSNKIIFYTKNQTTQGEETTVVDNILFEYNDLSISKNDKFCIKIHPNIQSFNITPKPINFKDVSKKFKQDNDYNRQCGTFIKKSSDTSSLGLNTKGIFPNKNLVFYFDFQNIVKYYGNYQCFSQITSKIGNYLLRSRNYYEGYGYKYYYFSKTNGFDKNGLKLNSVYTQESNFTIIKNFQQFTLIGYVKKDYDYNYSFPDLFGFGFYRQPNEYIQEKYYDKSNMDKGFGFYIQSGKIGVRFNARKYIIDQVLNTNQWYHVCLTYDKTQLRAYINGQLLLQENLNGQVLQQANKFYIGTSRDYSNNYWNNDYSEGVYNYSLDEIACFDKCLSNFFISSIYKSKAVL